jgi:hypothetical protein
MPTEVNSERRARRRRSRRKRITRLEGQRFGMLVVEREVGVHRTLGGTLRRVWECRCDCGNLTQVTQRSLLRYEARSCGCLRRDAAGAAARAHRREYHAQRWRTRKPVYAAFRELLRPMMELRGLTPAGIRTRWHLKPSRFTEIILKRRSIPSAAEAEAMADMMNLRFRDRDEFLQAAAEARLQLVQMQDKRVRENL